MSTQLNLKEIERKAFRSTYQDGLWDIYYGVIVVCMSIFIYHPADGYSAKNILLVLLMFTVAYSLFRAGKKYITLPRMGQVRFGAVRKQKKRTLGMILGVFVLIHAGLVGLTWFGRANPEASTILTGTINNHGNLPGLLIVATVASLIVGTSMMLIAYSSDFPRGYTIAVMMALAVFLMIYLNHPVYPIIIGGLIILSGLVLLVRFLRTHPLQRENASDE